MFRSLIIVVIGFFAAPSFAKDIFFGGGFDLQLSDNKLDGGTTYEHPDNRPSIGGGVGAFIRFERMGGFAIRTGAEAVSRIVRQEYDAGLFITSDGRSRYDVVSFEFPLYAEFFLGDTDQAFYAGPKIAMTMYDHCSATVSGTGAIPCMDNAVSRFFVPFQVGYILRFQERQGLTFFIETTLTPVVDKGPLHSNLIRSGALFNIYL
jgi:hypothetical protein